MNLSASGFSRLIPLMTPAINEKNLYEEDVDLEISRIGILAISSFAILMISSSVVAPISFGLILLSPLDTWRTARKVDANAVNEYLKNLYPSSSATFRIQNRIQAAQLLINKNGDVNKINEKGERLIDYCRDLDIFKLFLQHGADVIANDKYGHSYFKRAVEDENPDYLECILKSNKVSVAHFTFKQQIKFWISLGSIKAGNLLSYYGFNVNVRDRNGYTPLLKLVEEASRPFFIERRLGIEVHVRTLLECGADPLLTICKNNKEICASQINTNPVLAPLL